MKKLYVILSMFFLIAIVSGCESYEEQKAQEGIVKLPDAKLLEASLINGEKYLIFRSKEEKIIKIKVTWDDMPSMTVGENYTLYYQEKSNKLDSYILN